MTAINQKRSKHQNKCAQKKKKKQNGLQFIHYLCFHTFCFDALKKKLKKPVFNLLLTLSFV